jgi:hypothetical protein
MLLYSDDYEPNGYDDDQYLIEPEDDTEQEYDWATVESELFGDC